MTSEIIVLIVIATAIFGSIQLGRSISMIILCAALFEIFRSMRYEHIHIDVLSRRLKQTTDLTMRALIADKRFKRVVAGSYDMWTIGKQWRV